MQNLLLVSGESLSFAEDTSHIVEVGDLIGITLKCHIRRTGKEILPNQSHETTLESEISGVQYNRRK